MSIEYVDRRGEKKIVEAPSGQRLEASVTGGDAEEINRVSSECSGEDVREKKVIEFKKQVRGEKLSWKSVGYVVAFLPMGQAQILMVRAVGMRTDERVFTADYAFPPMLEEGQDFVGEARKRLETFLACSCDEGGRCKFHGETCPGLSGPGRWMEDDIKRLRKIQSGPMPEAVEILMKAEAARAQNRIVVPGRPQ
jgi:hypothetical protein